MNKLIVAIMLILATGGAMAADAVKTLQTCLHAAPGRSPSYGSAAIKAGFRHEAHPDCQPQPLEKK